MNYPSLDEVEAADLRQLCKWYRFLPNPGTGGIGSTEFNAVLETESAIMNRIAERWYEAGGFTPAISKAIGWEPPIEDA